MKTTMTCRCTDKVGNRDCSLHGGHHTADGVPDVSTEARALEREVCDSQFSCGNWTDADENYDGFSERATNASAALLRYIASLEVPARVLPLFTPADWVAIGLALSLAPVGLIDGLDEAAAKVQGVTDALIARGALRAPVTSMESQMAIDGVYPWVHDTPLPMPAIDVPEIEQQTVGRTGAVELTRQAWAKIHRDYKSISNGQRYAFAGALGLPGNGTNLVPVVLVKGGGSG